MEKLFGTDGIRGKAGEFPLDVETVAVMGRSLAAVLTERIGRPPRLIIGRDTRESGNEIENAFCSGASASSAECVSAGVIPTPGVAFLTASQDFDAGIVISASHNPFEDNGIKVFMPNGTKADRRIEERIESDIAAGTNNSTPLSGIPETADTSHKAEHQEKYARHLLESFASLDLTGLSVVVDCANGASSHIAPDLFQNAGAAVTAINARPDGRNINLNCGSLHLEGLRAAVIDRGADLGIAFDGDADRSLFVDKSGAIVDGDATLWILGKHYLENELLKSRTVIATVMSNIGLELAFRGLGVELLRTPVGDKYVLDKLLETGAELGGEQSGHIIMPGHSLVGDGMFTALSVLAVMNEKRKSVAELVSGFTAYPQVLVNVKVSKKKPFEEIPAVAAAVAEIERELEGNGRLLLRYSGTENLARVMIEGSDQARINETANSLASLIGRSLNGV